jgi:hypothetical protein
MFLNQVKLCTMYLLKYWYLCVVIYMIDFMVNIFVFPNEKQMLSIVLLSLIYKYNVSLVAKKTTCYNKTINYFKTKKPTTKKVLVSVGTQVKLLFMNINHKSQSINVWVSREHLQRLRKPS